jgi:hypothetical protein
VDIISILWRAIADGRVKFRALRNFHWVDTRMPCGKSPKQTQSRMR